MNFNGKMDAMRRATEEMCERAKHTPRQAGKPGTAPADPGTKGTK